MGQMKFKGNAENLVIDTNVYPECAPLIERASALIKAGKKPFIRIFAVPFKIQCGQHFKELRARIYQLYKVPAYGFATALHEAAHAIVLEDDGVPNVRLTGPGIQYNKHDGSLFAYGARVDHDEKPILTFDEQKIFESTMRMSVGGVAQEQYAGIVEPSDDGDYGGFLKNYLALPEGLVKDDPKVYWKKAQDAAILRLDLPETKAKIFARIPEYLDVLYVA
jgi:hypothetical protein